MFTALSAYFRPLVPLYRLASRVFSLSVHDSIILSEENRLLCDSVQQFAQNDVQPHVVQMDQEGKMNQNIIKKLFENGYMGIEIPSQYGGSQMGLLESCLVIKELSKIDPSVALIVDVHNTLVITCFLHYASKFLQEKYLPLLASHSVGCFCLSESQSGSDAFSLRCKAEIHGDHYILNGQKLWITNAHEADIFIIMASTDFQKKAKGISAFVVDRNNPGLQIGRKEDKLGLRASSTCEIILNDCKVMSDHRIGEEGQGYKIAIELLNEGRIGIASQMVGASYGIFDQIMPYMLTRSQFGQLICDFQGMQFQYAHLRTELEAAELLLHNAITLREKKHPIAFQASMAKLYTSQVAQRIASSAIDWAGGIGFTKSFPLEKFYRDVKASTLYEGTTNMQLQTIAKLFLQQYRDKF